MKTFLSIPLAKQLSIGSRVQQVLLLPLLIFTLMGALYVKELSLQVYTVGLYLFFITALLYAAIFLWLMFASDHFKVGAIVVVIIAFFYGVVLKLRSLKYHPEWSALLGVFLMSVLVSFLCYQDFQGYEEVTMQVDGKLSDRWATLWKTCVGVCVFYVISRIIVMTPAHIGKVMIGRILVHISSTLMVLVQCVKWFLLKDTAKVFSRWQPNPEGESITQELDIRKIHWIENTKDNEYEVHTWGEKVYTFISFPYPQMCDYLEKRGITELVPISDKQLINIRHIKNIFMDDKGNRIVQLSGVKKQLYVARSYAKMITWWNFK